MSRINRKLCISIFVVLFAPLLVHAEGRFQGYDFSFKGEITDVITEDLNQDGLEDLVVIRNDKNTTPPGRYLNIILQDKDKGFDKSRMSEWKFPAQVAAVDVGDVLPDKGKEVVFITERGVSAAPIVSGKVGKLKSLVETQSVVALPYDREVPYYNFARDFTGDGRDDILVCGFYDAMVMVQGDDYNFDKQTLNLRPTVDIDAFDFEGMMGSDEDTPLFRVAYYVPVTYAKDYNGDGRPDIIVNYRGNIKIFEQTDSGFTKDPVREYKIKIFEQDNTPSHRRNYPNIFFEDFDKDGKVDILANQVKGDLRDLQARTLIFYGKSDNILKGKPDLELKSEKTALGVGVQDINNDGLLDIRAGTLDLNAWTAGKALLTGDVTVYMAYYIQNPDGTFNENPTSVYPTDLSFSLSKMRLTSGIPNFHGDFNGDGFPDQVIGEGEDMLVISLRDKEGKPLEYKEEIQVPVSLITKADDLNNDGLSDIIVFYREREDHLGDLHVFLNRGPWTFEE